MPVPYRCEIIKELRVIGEFVGTDKTHPSGPIAAFRQWLELRLGSETNVTGIAASHQAIVNMVLDKAAQVGSGDPHSFIFPQSGLQVLDEGDPSRLMLSDFDIVAWPAYLIPHAFSLLEVLREEESHVNTADRIGSIDTRYLRESILGPAKYGYFPQEGGHQAFVGYPLFVDFALLAVNRQQILQHDFINKYFYNEQRHFRGFMDPADVLAIARAASRSAVPARRLIMTLKEGHIAQWYEWQTVISIFGGIDFDLGAPWQEIDEQVIEHLTSRTTARATRYYLELCDYAGRDSNAADWDKAIKLFYEDRSVGMAFIWPDAIPQSYREQFGAQALIYAAPSCVRHPEECWLLVIPKHRRAETPSLEVLQELLADFMTYENQQRYQELGGITTHRRVLDNVDLWHSCAILPHLRALRDDEYVFLRASSAKARQAAVRIVDALDELRAYVKRELATQKDDDGSTDHLWHKEEFVSNIEAEILRTFESVKTSIMGG